VASGWPVKYEPADAVDMAAHRTGNGRVGKFLAPSPISRLPARNTDSMVETTIISA
jgi:hypothetical protein